MNTPEEKNAYTTGMSATYSPDDNKLRLYAVGRLDTETYAQVKAAGFSYAPKQELFVAPAWTPSREDLLIELCGEIGDEDTSLTTRAEQRAERFEEYSDARARDAESASKAVSAIADNIPLGQPILVGHHSERHARKHAEQIENGMRRTIKMWETSAYWEQRAAGALAHARYKEDPGVRHRRIKTIEADKRKQEKIKAEGFAQAELWESHRDVTREEGHRIAGRIAYGGFSLVKGTKDYQRWTAYDVLDSDEGRYADCPAWTVAQVVEKVRKIADATAAYCDRWIQHYDNRLTYERAMLGEKIITARAEMEVGGRVLIDVRHSHPRVTEWVVILKINKGAGGEPVSVRANKGGWRGIVQVEDIQDYKEPEAADVAEVAKAKKLPPLCNYPGPGFTEMTKAEFGKRYGQWIKVVSPTETRRYLQPELPKGCAVHRIRIYHVYGGGETHHHPTGVYITDMKRTDPPMMNAAEHEPAQFEAQVESIAPTRQAIRDTSDEKLDKADAMKDALKAGVQVVSAPQLFPTPMDLARRMVEMAGVQPGECVLEPSAGTGNLVDAVLESVDTEVLAYEINAQLCVALGRKHPGHKLQVRHADFLEVTEFQGCYPVVLMNPPFAGADDIKHIRHAIKFLAPGGRLVAICAGGPRQEAALQPIADYWEPLPAGTFESSGTQVSTVLLMITAPTSQGPTSESPDEPERGTEATRPQEIDQPAHSACPRKALQFTMSDAFEGQAELFA